MTYLAYVERQKRIIRASRAAKESLVARGQTSEGEQGCESYKSLRLEKAQSEELTVFSQESLEKISQRLLSEISAMKGLNRKEREFFAARAV